MYLIPKEHWQIIYEILSEFTLLTNAENTLWKCLLLLNLEILIISSTLQKVEDQDTQI